MKLKPCPFCGKKPVIKREDVYYVLHLKCKCECFLFELPCKKLFENTNEINDEWNKRSYYENNA
jgi:hypothetical protein